MKALLFLYLFFPLLSIAQYNKDEQAIRNVLQQQIKGWNSGDIDIYMQGYWNNDSLVFVGKNGPTYGYKETLERYKRSYSDTVKMGKLSFDLLQVKPLAQDVYFVLGKWHLIRSVGNLDGSFTLVFRRIKNRWVIVADHSS